MGHVHRPWPMCGASLGAYLTFTSQWSVGVDVGHISQSNVQREVSWDVYMRSRRDWIWWPLAFAL